MPPVFSKLSLSPAALLCPCLFIRVGPGGGAVGQKACPLWPDLPSHAACPRLQQDSPRLREGGGGRNRRLQARASVSLSLWPRISSQPSSPNLFTRPNVPGEPPPKPLGGPHWLGQGPLPRRVVLSPHAVGMTASLPHAPPSVQAESSTSGPFSPIRDRATDFRLPLQRQMLLSVLSSLLSALPPPPLPPRPWPPGLRRAGDLDAEHSFPGLLCWP